MTAAHVVPTPTPGTVPAPPIPSPWRRISRILTGHLPTLTDRTDLSAVCAPGAASGAAACYLPTEKRIEIDADLFGTLDPTTLRPGLVKDRARYASVWGAFVHETAHARHSQWAHGLNPATIPPLILDAALLLEESRIERLQLARKRSDRRWLRACVKTIVANPATPAGPTGPGSRTLSTRTPATVLDAARAAGLFLARVDAGVLNRRETRGIRAAVTTVLGPDRLDTLTTIWREAHRVADDDHDSMLALARRWLDALRGPAAGSDNGTLARATDDLLDALHDGPPRPEPEPDPEPAPAPPPASRSGGTQLAGTRPPTSAEREAAARFGRALQAAARREPVPVTTTSPVPPGRLRMRGALAADAQRAAGAVPTARPFTRTVRKAVPNPPLRIGIACDVSGSMRRHARAVASAGWITAQAAARVPHATTSMVIFGEKVVDIVAPGRPPASVTEFASIDGTEKFTKAVDRLDDQLGLSHPGGARLLVVISDGGFVLAGEKAGGQERVDRLRAAGCAVLWLVPDTAVLTATPARGAHVVTISASATDTIRAISHAARRALTTT
jgi:hypothetical protein